MSKSKWETCVILLILCYNQSRVIKTWNKNKKSSKRMVYLRSFEKQKIIKNIKKNQDYRQVFFTQTFVCLILLFSLPQCFLIYFSALSFCLSSPLLCLFLTVPPAETYPLCLIALFWFLLPGWCLSEIGGWGGAGVYWLCVSGSQNKNNCLLVSLTHHRFPDCICVCACLKINTCCV